MGKAIAGKYISFRATEKISEDIEAAFVRARTENALVTKSEVIRRALIHSLSSPERLTKAVVKGVEDNY